MSSKTKLTKFKNAVAASSSSSSSSPSASRSSSPKLAASSSSTASITVSQANTLQALHQEQLARLASTTLPNLASAHSRRFLHLARSQTQANDAMWSTQKVQAIKYRRSLWAEDVDPEAEVAVKEKDRIVPDFYHKHNPRCSRCALPLVPGLNKITLDRRGTRGGTKARNMKEQGKARKRVSSCTLCHHKTRTT